MSILEYLKENDLAWQPSFSGEVASGVTGYRGSIIIEEGQQISPDRKLPPKSQAKQVILVNEDEKIKFFTCELESFAHLEPFVAKYKDFFAPDSINVLYVIDLDGNGTFEYEGIKFTALVLDESSVWNEILELVDLEKGDLKKMSAEEKIEEVYDAAKDADIDEASKTYDEMKALVGDSKKALMGAV
jgi:hypothetical protein